MKKKMKLVNPTIKTICKTCGVPILIIKTDNKKAPVIIDGSKAERNEKGQLVIYRHVCKE